MYYTAMLKTVCAHTGLGGFAATGHARVSPPPRCPRGERPPLPLAVLLPHTTTVSVVRGGVVRVALQRPDHEGDAAASGVTALEFVAPDQAAPALASALARMLTRAHGDLMRVRARFAAVQQAAMSVADVAAARRHALRELAADARVRPCLEVDEVQGLQTGLGFIA